MTDDMRYWPILTTRGICRVEAYDEDHACRIVLKYEGRSASPRPCGDDARVLDKPTDAYLSESGWCYSDGKPYLGIGASFLQAFGATYEEMQAYAAADLDTEHGTSRKRAVIDGMQKRQGTGPYAPKPVRKDSWRL